MDEPAQPRIEEFPNRLAREFASVRRELARVEQVAGQVGPLTTGDPRPGSRAAAAAYPYAYPPEQTVHLARLHAARAALDLAVALLEGEDVRATDPVRAALAALGDEVKTWRRSGRGWFEDRRIKKVRPVWAKNEQGKAYIAAVEDVS